MTHQQPDSLARLRADRNTALVGIALEVWAESNRLTLAREVGYRHAVEVLSWSEVSDYRLRLASLGLPQDWLGRPGESILITLQGKEFALRGYFEYRAYLEGIEAAAVAVEAAD